MHGSNETIIAVRDVTIGYNDTIILEHVSFDVCRGEIFVIMGGSGCGKSTLLKHLIGLLQPQAGQIIVNGIDVNQSVQEETSRLFHSFGVTYQSGALFGSMTLRENVSLPLEEFTTLPQEARDRVAAMKLRLVGLEGYEDHLPAEISGGMQKRAAIARAMALDPTILFLDEPSAGLDPVTSAELDQLIIHLSSSLAITFVIVTHELESIYTVAHRVIMLDKEAKGIIAEGLPQTLKNESQDPRVRHFFNREVSTSLG